MNGLNNSADDVAECPLCMEPLEVDDLNFYPCTCGYQICRFCWHRIRTDENELCPACRKEYPENPADFTPLTQEEMIAFKSQKRQRDQQRKQKITENRKHLANVRVVQKNLVFVVGLPPRLADADILKKHEYFGKYGKIHKVVINPSTTYAGVQGPSASAYVTYVHNSDALRAIQSVNNINIDGRLIKTSLGTTKYCSHFMKNQPCPKGDCMYLHELGDPEASFTKEEMHQGKHQEYEKRLHDALIATAGANTANGIGGGQLTPALNGGIVNAINMKNGGENGKVANANSTSSSMSSSSSSGSSSSSSSTSLGTNSNMSSVITLEAQKEAWPSLMGATTNNKDNTNTSAKTKKDKSKNERSKNDKKTKLKNNQNNIMNNNSKNNSSSNLNNGHAKDIIANEETNQKTNSSDSSGKAKTDKTKEKTSEKSTSGYQQHSKEKILKDKSATNSDEEIKLINEIEKQTQQRNNKRNATNKHQNSNEVVGNASKSKILDRENEKIECNKRSNSSSSNDSMSSNGSSDTASSLSESVSGKSSPETESYITEKTNENSKSENHSAVNLDRSINNYISDNNFVEETRLDEDDDDSGNVKEQNIGNTVSKETEIAESVNSSSTTDSNIVNTSDASVLNNLNTNCNSSPCNNLLLDTSAALSKLNLFDDNNSYFSSTAATSFQQSLFLKNKQGLAGDLREGQLNSVISSHLPDLLSGIDGNQNNTNSNDWGEAFKNIMRSNKQMEEQLQKQHFQQQQLHMHHQQEEYLRMQDLQKRNNLFNNMGLSQMNGTHNDFSNIGSSFHGGNSDLNRLAQTSMLHPHQTQQLLPQSAQQTPQSGNADHLLDSTHFGPNMSKFFDFHKNQQQQQQQQIQQQFLLNTSNPNGMNSMNDHLRMNTFLESSRMASQFLDQTNIMPTQQQLVQKQRVVGKFDGMPAMHNQQVPQKPQQQPQQLPQQQQNRLVPQFPQNVSVEDDLGFDPFIETQKGLAELMENEVVVQQQQQQQQQQQHSSTTSVSNTATSMATKFLQQQQQQQHQHLENMQRARMPPPGFNHMNSYNFGGTSRVQNGSKILPFMNVPHGGMGGNNQLPAQQQQQQQQMQMPHAWSPQMNAYQQQQQQQLQQQPTLNDQQMHQLQNQHQNNANHKGYSSNDWTAMDPAILSLRQFSNFSQQPSTMPHHPPAQDLFMQHMPQQQNNQAFVTQPSLHNNVNLPNGLLGVQQQASQAQTINSHINWLSNETSFFSNTITNCISSNTCDKLSYTMPSAMNHTITFNKQQKMDCFN